MDSTGMSRAAKKRAKKRTRVVGLAESAEPSKQSKGGERGSRADGFERSNNATVESKKEDVSPAPDRRRNITSAKKHTAVANAAGDDAIIPIMDEVHTSDDDDDDETVAMKVAASASAPEIAVLPQNCTKLIDILLLDEDSEHGSCDAEVMDAFSCMTARQRAHCALAFLLRPAAVTVAAFYETYWEKGPLHVQSDDAHRLDGFLTLGGIRNLLSKETLYYGKDLNVTRYEKSADGVPQRRVTLDEVKETVTGKVDGDGFVQAHGRDVWRHWDAGGTVRLLCPHRHCANTHALLSLLELEWGCMTGANAYLTPGNAAQGFAPHYDDVDAFCLQLQGRKRWRVYAPLRMAERLPRASSADYAAADLTEVAPVLDVVLTPGDVLYMPRGWIHQACTLPDDPAYAGDAHSLHVTISAMQQWAWADLMEILLPEALEAVASSETSLSMREGLPPRFLGYMGAVHDNRDENVPDILRAKAADGLEASHPGTVTRTLQDKFRRDAKKRIMQVAKEAIGMLDAACDQMGKRFIMDRLPPALTQAEKAETSAAAPAHVKVLPTALCRLVRPGIARLVLENGAAVLYHCADNAVVYRDNPLSPMEFELDDAPAIEQLLTTVPPHWICVADLIHDSVEDKVSVAQALYDESIIAMRI